MCAYHHTTYSTYWPQDGALKNPNIGSKSAQPTGDILCWATTGGSIKRWSRFFHLQCEPEHLLFALQNGSAVMSWNARNRSRLWNKVSIFPGSQPRWFSIGTILTPRRPINTRRAVILGPRAALHLTGCQSYRTAPPDLAALQS